MHILTLPSALLSLLLILSAFLEALLASLCIVRVSRWPASHRVTILFFANILSWLALQPLLRTWGIPAFELAALLLESAILFALLEGNAWPGRLAISLLVATFTNLLSFLSSLVLAMCLR